MENLYFYVFNKHYNQAWKINGTQMVDNIIKEATGPTYRIPKGETFYHVPYQEAEKGRHSLITVIL